MKYISEKEYTNQRIAMPLTTNHINVKINEQAFFEKYAIVSYWSDNKEFKNIPYEKISSDINFISVAGIRSIWTGTWETTRFFVLVNKTNRLHVTKVLQGYGDISYQEDYLAEYNDNTRKRIFASLAINSIGKMKADSMMYSNGSLLVCDNRNFNLDTPELVCLNINVNGHLNLNARVNSFDHPKTEAQLMKANCVFQVSSSIHGNWWLGKAVKPVVVHNQKNKKFNLEDYYIKGKHYKRTKNIVPYWPYNREQYTHGKLFVIKQVVESVNKEYEGMLSLEFVIHKLEGYYESQTQKDTESLIKDYMCDKIIFFDNKIKTELSKEHVSLLKQEVKDYMDNNISFARTAKNSDMNIILCEPQKDNLVESLYTQSIKRMMLEGIATQHVVHNQKKKENKVNKAIARRILMELLVKDCVAKQTIPSEIANKMSSWEFSMFREKDDYAIGTTMTVNSNGDIKFSDFGFPGHAITDFKLHFIANYKCKLNDKIRTFGSYYTLKKGNNAYIIIDTEEIPMLDTETINDGYAELSDKVSENLFKKKDNIQKYFNGYIGLSYWKTDDLLGNQGRSYAYISGFNRNLNDLRSDKLEKMPRVRYICLLKAAEQERVDQDVLEILELLKYGFARWNELLTYPFPFKFIKEYLDNQSEIAFSCHWDEITLKE